LPLIATPTGGRRRNPITACRVRYTAKKTGKTAKQIKRAVKKVGTNRKKVVRALGRKK